MENSEKIEPSVELGDEANVEPVPGGDFLAEAVAALEAEEAVLEDLCEEADLEVENTTLGGNVSNQQKAELLSRLSTNQNTKQYFQVHFFISYFLIVVSKCYSKVRLNAE